MIELDANGQFSANNGVNGYGGTYKRTTGGFRVNGDVVGTAVGDGGTKPSEVAVHDAMFLIIERRADVNTNVSSGQLQLSVPDYQIFGVPTE
jgi:hypothetical protein